MLRRAQSASRGARSRPSQKFGTDSSGSRTLTTVSGVKTYYDRRAFEYDDWWLGRGRFAERERPGWDDEVGVLAELVGSLPPKRALDVACGDQSERMLAVAREQAPGAEFVLGDALDLPFADGAFERLFTSYFYCHLEPDERAPFLAEARRVASELVV